MIEYIIFIICSFINVLAATVKSVITVKGSKLSAAIVNAISYAINTIVIVFTAADFPLIAKIIISAGTNFIGVYIGIAILEKLKKKNKIWEIVATIKQNNFNVAYNGLANIDHIIFNCVDSTDNKYKIFTIYTHNKNESKLVKNILDSVNAYTMVHEESVKL